MTEAEAVAKIDAAIIAAGLTQEWGNPSSRSQYGHSYETWRNGIREEGAAASSHSDIAAIVDRFIRHLAAIAGTRSDPTNVAGIVWRRRPEINTQGKYYILSARFHLRFKDEPQKPVDFQPSDGPFPELPQQVAA